MNTRQILDVTDTVSTTFYVAATNYGQIHAGVKVTQHPKTGDPWVLENLAPDGTWIPLDVEFEDIGYEIFRVMPGDAFRLTGGPVGSKAFAVGVV